MNARSSLPLANVKINTALQKAIKDEVDKNIKTNVKNTVIKYVSVFAIISNVLSVGHSKHRI
ncbi:hypothetical protein DOE59_06095 [Salmonella enterica subsp. diarizonae serovar 48:i:z]|uniref:Uncharacterized protein n=1 Tax=Salmonella enterica subsp. diarizonae serovar 48:i:z TaxID=1192842 RepID=A0A7U6BDK7_SALDZ|nr:hypothetical protein DOE59_06095 [Salmonella enterica subsp. diarizonae serovar 48:i:z]EAA4451704.1 hypothetical protein [Salmonella enterica subsp. diarizonae]EAM2671203.1 hypothetical protein [Salmonella enterica]EAM6403593.1 hypothetical protein [Salmonella enterica]EAN2414562.1 hypothetical protein [Salmonella enterica]